MNGLTFIFTESSRGGAGWEGCAGQVWCRAVLGALHMRHSEHPCGGFSLFSVPSSCDHFELLLRSLSFWFCCLCFCWFLLYLAILSYGYLLYLQLFIILLKNIYRAFCCFFLSLDWLHRHTHASKYPKDNTYRWCLKRDNE